MLQFQSSEIQLNNPEADGHPGTVNLYFPGCEAEMICANLASEIALSAAAACNGLKNEYSYVLQKMGLSEEQAASSVRLCFGKDNSNQEVSIAVKKIASVFQKLKGD